VVSRGVIDRFLEQRRLALAGASRGGSKFGNTVLRELRGKGYDIIPVHPEARQIDGVACRASLADLPEGVEGLVLVVPPAQTERLLREAAAHGIRRAWIQPGAESPAALEICREAGIEAVHGVCILMFAEPAGWIHRLHRGINRLTGRLPR